MSSRVVDHQIQPVCVPCDLLRCGRDRVRAGYIHGDADQSTGIGVLERNQFRNVRMPGCCEDNSARTQAVA